MLNLHDLRVELLQSEARHLLLFVFNKKQQMPRCAPHDKVLLPSTCKFRSLCVTGPQTPCAVWRHSHTSGRAADPRPGSALRTTMAFPGAGLQDLSNLFKGEVYLLFAVVEVRRKPNAGLGTVVDEDIARQQFARYLARVLALH
jgi:hypothetical protein